MLTFLKGRLIIETGDITQSDADAIVNAANTTLLGGGGVDGAIHRKAGPTVLEDCKKIRKGYPNGLPAGKAVVSIPGRLKCRKIIHTVGPVWSGGKNEEDQILEQAYLSSLTLAKNLGLKTIAFPAISTGAFDFPKERAAKIVYKCLTKYLQENELPERIFLIFHSENDKMIFIDTIGTEIR